jgi:hypothetical protein
MQLVERLYITHEAKHQGSDTDTIFHSRKERPSCDVASVIWLFYVPFPESSNRKKLIFPDWI